MSEYKIDVTVLPNSQKGEVEYRLMLEDKVACYLRIKQTNLILTLSTDFMRLVDNGLMTFDYVISQNENYNIYSIDYIGVPDNLRRQGYATILLSHVINLYKDKEIYLMVEPMGIDYDILVRFYSKYNFKILSEWENYGKEKRNIMYRKPSL